MILTEPPLGWDPSHTNPPGGLEAYYRNNVIGGQNSFVMVAESFKAFSQAILNKLIAEVAATEPKQHAVANALARLGVADAVSAAGSAARHSAILSPMGTSRPPPQRVGTDGRDRRTTTPAGPRAVLRCGGAC